MILKSLITAVAAVALAGSAAAEQQGHQEDDAANVLVLKVMDKEQTEHQGQEGSHEQGSHEQGQEQGSHEQGQEQGSHEQGQEQEETTEQAYLIPLSIDKLPLDKDGNVDVEALADLCEDMEQSAEWIALDANQLDEASLPEEVAQEFADAEQADLDDLKQRLS